MSFQKHITTPLTYSLVLHIVKLSCVEYIADLEMTFSVNPPEAWVGTVSVYM